MVKSWRPRARLKLPAEDPSTFIGASLSTKLLAPCVRLTLSGARALPYYRRWFSAVPHLATGRGSWRTEVHMRKLLVGTTEREIFCYFSRHTSIRWKPTSSSNASLMCPHQDWEGSAYLREEYPQFDTSLARRTSNGQLYYAHEGVPDPKVMTIRRDSFLRVPLQPKCVSEPDVCLSTINNVLS